VNLLAEELNDFQFADTWELFALMILTVKD
jgi:hypothetical protein